VDGAERAVAITKVVDQDAESREVVDLVELLAADHHLLVDGVQVLRAPIDIGLDARLTQPRTRRLQYSIDVLLAFAPAPFDEACDLPVRAGVKRLERQVLELPFDLLDAEPVGQRGVDVECLRRDPALLVDLER
jgi:hypothetical protein